MKTLRSVLIMLFAMATAGCGRGKTTNTTSDAFATLASKQAFVEQYVTFRRSYEDLHFHIAFIDGGAGLVPGPTEWDIRIVAVVPDQELDEWSRGLIASDSPDTQWVRGLPRAPANLDHFAWFADGRRLVGIDRTKRVVLYRNHAS